VHIRVLDSRYSTACTTTVKVVRHCWWTDSEQPMSWSRGILKASSDSAHYQLKLNTWRLANIISP